MSQLIDNDSSKTAIVTDDPDFNAADTDVCVVSSDNVRFKVHSTNLQTHTSVFPAMTLGSANDPAHLTERAEVLRIIFKYIYPDSPLPKLGHLPFSTLEEVAMAADKYQFLVLSELCDCYMEHHHATAHPAEVLRYAFLRGANDILDRVAPHTISLDTFDTARVFKPDLFQQWILYREACVAFMGALIPARGDTYKEVEARLKEWSSRNSTPIPPRFSLSLTSTPEAYTKTWGNFFRGRELVVHLRISK